MIRTARNHGTILTLAILAATWAVRSHAWSAELISSDTPPPLTAPDAPLDVRRDATVQAVEKVQPSVVNIATRAWVENDPQEQALREYFGYKRKPDTQYSRGSGVIISEDGYVLTNVHVVGDANEIWVTLSDNSEPIPAERVAVSQDKDVAILRLKPKEPRRFRPVRFAKDDDLLLGETVLALGNPFGLSGSISRGILSSKSRRQPASTADEGHLDIADWLQTDASINPGNSGGPLVNLRGELIGLNVAILNPKFGAQGIGFAIPIRRVNQALAEVLSGESVGNGPERYWFGARLEPGLRPLTVKQVQPGSPAAAAGLMPKDVILEVNKSRSGSMIDFNQALITAGDQEDLNLTVRRHGETRQLSLRLVQERKVFNNELIRQRLGMTLKPMQGSFAVASIERGSPAAKAGLVPGNYIVAMDGQLPEDLVSAAKLVASKGRGETIDLGVILVERSGFFARQFQASISLTIR